MITDPLERRRAYSRDWLTRREPVVRGFSFVDERDQMLQSTGSCRKKALSADWSDVRRGMRLAVTLPCNDEGGAVQ